VKPLALSSGLANIFWMKKIWMIVTLCALSLATGACAKKSVISGKSLEGDLSACTKLSKKKRFDEAIECLEIFKSRYAGSGAAKEAMLAIADNFFRDEDFLLAAETYEGFLKNNPFHARTDYAFYRLGLSYLKASPKAIDRDQEHLDEAIRAFETQLRLYPNSSLRTESEQQLAAAREKVGRRNFYIGSFYFRTQEYRAAIPRLRTVIDHYSHIPQTPKAYAYLTMAHAKLQHFDSARSVFSAMEQQFPTTKETKKTGKRLRRLMKKEKKE
jgi:outer membrane protein assembly factor BamD